MGIISTAGAIAGAGQGITQAGEHAQKLDIIQKMNELQQAREEAIERLRAGEQEKLQGKGQEFEKEQTQTKLEHASAAAGATREFEAKQNEAARTSHEQIGKGHDIARVDAAKITSAARAEAKGPAKIWVESKPLTSMHIDPKLGPVSDQKSTTFNNFTGHKYVQIGDKMVPWDANANAPANDPKALRRPNPDEYTSLMRDPLGVIPDGPNAGMSQAEVFEQVHGYLPTQWTSAAARAANPKDHPMLFSSSSSQPSMAGSKGENPDAGAADNQAQSDDDSASGAPAFQSNAMGSYNANSQ